MTSLKPKADLEVPFLKPFTTFTKSSILDVTGPDPPLKTATLWLIIKASMFLQKLQLVILGAVQIFK